MDEKQFFQKELNEKLDQKIEISRRDVILILIIVGLLIFISFQLAYLIRGNEDENVLLNTLAWWKVQRDCSQCDEWTCTVSSYKLSPYNLSGLSQYNLSNTD